jgi:hypothetical protein
VAITAAPLDAASAAALGDLVDTDLPVVVEVWGERGTLASAARHAERLADALALRSPRVLEVPVAFEHTDELVAAAGPVVAWGGLETVVGESR